MSSGGPESGRDYPPDPCPPPVDGFNIELYPVVQGFRV